LLINVEGAMLRKRQVHSLMHEDRQGVLPRGDDEHRDDKACCNRQNGKRIKRSEKLREHPS
jgi:hypothetical protein